MHMKHIWFPLFLFLIININNVGKYYWNLLMLKWDVNKNIVLLAKMKVVKSCVIYMVHLMNLKEK